MNFKLGAIMKTQAATQIAGQSGHGRVWGGAGKGLRKALALIERHHKRKEWVRSSGGRLSGAAVHPTKLTIRTGTLSKSYTRQIAEKMLRGSYGSDLVYAPVHEYGGRHVKARPGLKRTVNATADKVEKIMADAIAKEF